MIDNSSVVVIFIRSLVTTSFLSLSPRIVAAAAMPGLEVLVTRYQLLLTQWLASSSVKRFVTLVVLFLSIYYAYDRITRARRREQLLHARTADTAPPTTAVTTRSAAAHPPSFSAAPAAAAVAAAAPSSSSSSAPVQRLLTSLSTASPGKALPLSPTAKYLMPSKPARCVVLSVPHVVLDERDRPVHRVVPLLTALAQHTRLVLITQTEDTGREQSAPHISHTATAISAPSCDSHRPR